MNFNDIFGENVPYDNLKSRKKPAFHPVLKWNFGKNKGGRREGAQTDAPTPPSLFRSMIVVVLLKVFTAVYY